jgi:hypothetical protein
VITTISMLVDAASTAPRICGSIHLAQRSPVFSAYKRRVIVFGAVLFTDDARRLLEDRALWRGLKEGRSLTACSQGVCRTDFPGMEFTFRGFWSISWRQAGTGL